MLILEFRHYEINCYLRLHELEQLNKNKQNYTLIITLLLFFTLV